MSFLETEKDELACSGYGNASATRQKERAAYKEFAASLSLDLPWTRERE